MEVPSSVPASASEDLTIVPASSDAPGTTIGASSRVRPTVLGSQRLGMEVTPVPFHNKFAPLVAMRPTQRLVLTGGEEFDSRSVPTQRPLGQAPNPALDNDHDAGIEESNTDSVPWSVAGLTRECQTPWRNVQSM